MRDAPRLGFCCKFIPDDGNGETATVGITDYAQTQLGDIVFVELPAAGTQLTKGDEAAVVESVKAAAEVYAPVSGVVGEGNPSLEGDPALVNTAPEEAGWFGASRAILNADEFLTRE